MIIFIGTLHCGLTPEHELIEIINSFHPTALLVEIVQSDIDEDSIDNYPPEMIAAFTWAKHQNIKVYGFDAKIKTTKLNATNEDMQILDEEQSVVTKQYDWKLFNKTEIDNKIKTPTWYRIIDRDKEDQRNDAMYQTIRNLVSDSDTTVVITGSGHISYFKHKFPDAQFPLP